MPDSQQAHDRSPPGLPTPDELEQTVAELERVSREFSRRIADGRTAPATDSAAAPPPPPGPGEPASRPERPAAGDGFDERMRRAEREARLYLERAKHRADQLVNAMVAAIEREAAEIRRDAEEGIRERWRVVEEEAGRHLDDARRVADGMVGERQRQIGELSDGIVERAQTLTVGMEDAERIRSQFDDFVRALSRASDQIARSASAAGRQQGSQPGDGGPRRRGVLAA